ncbi:hypothetical protein TMatcc_001272 [Talaromyces marneffei ATCC 18224]
MTTNIQGYYNCNCAQNMLFSLCGLCRLFEDCHTLRDFTCTKAIDKEVLDFLSYDRIHNSNSCRGGAISWRKSVNIATRNFEINQPGITIGQCQESPHRKKDLSRRCWKFRVWLLNQKAQRCHEGSFKSSVETTDTKPVLLLAGSPFTVVIKRVSSSEKKVCATPLKGPDGGVVWFKANVVNVIMSPKPFLV